MAEQESINHLPSKFRKTASEKKYAKALSLYASTNLSIREIAEITGFKPDSLSAHIRRNHRDLILRRYSSLDEKNTQIDISDKIKSPKGQSVITKQKYNEAILACADSKYLDLNVSEIAHMFKLDPTALASQLKYHFPDILTERDKKRNELGISPNRQRGARKESLETYSDALQLYKDTDLTLVEIAEKCNVSPGGFGQFLRFYHKNLIEAKSNRRLNSRSSAKNKTPKISHRRREAAEKYAPAIENLRKNPRAITKVAADFNLNPDVFRIYLKKNHPDLCPARSAARSSKSSENKP